MIKSMQPIKNYLLLEEVEQTSKSIEKPDVKSSEVALDIFISKEAKQKQMGYKVYRVLNSGPDTKLHTGSLVTVLSSMVESVTFHEKEYLFVADNYAVGYFPVTFEN